MYEHRTQPLLSRAEFLRRLGNHASIAFGVVAGSLLTGVAAYHFLERLPWIDALLNAAMILGGMGPVDQLHTVSGKLFASFYALYAGVVFLVVAGVLFAPLFHRLIHRFHLETAEDGAGEGEGAGSPRRQRSRQAGTQRSLDH
jgi:hypothetical protein